MKKTEDEEDRKKKQVLGFVSLRQGVGLKRNISEIKLPEISTFMNMVTDNSTGQVGSLVRQFDTMSSGGHLRDMKELEMRNVKFRKLTIARRREEAL